jgi:hypothetical protein
VFPVAVTLADNGGVKQLLVEIGDFAEITGGATGTRYFAGNDSILSVSADGRITAVGEGLSTVTIIHDGAEFVVTVRVQHPVVGVKTIGSEGGAVQSTDGAVLAIAPGALTAAASVNITPVAENALPLAVPQGWKFLAGYDLEFGPQFLETPAQVAIPVSRTKLRSSERTTSRAPVRLRIPV